LHLLDRRPPRGERRLKLALQQSQTDRLPQRREECVLFARKLERLAGDGIVNHVGRFAAELHFDDLQVAPRAHRENAVGGGAAIIGVGHSSRLVAC